MALIREMSIIVRIIIVLVICKEEFWLTKSSQASIKRVKAFSMSPASKRSAENVLLFALPLNDFPFSLWCSLKSFLSWWDLDLCFALAPYGWRVFVWISSTFNRESFLFIVLWWQEKNNYCFFFLTQWENFFSSLDFMFCPLFQHKHRSSQCLLIELLQKALEAIWSTQHDNSPCDDIKDFAFKTP